MTRSTERRFETLAVHGGESQDPAPHPVSTPIYETVSYLLSDPESHGEGGRYYYSRMANPTVVALERAVAALEGGSHALAYGSGMAAAAGALSLLKEGDHLVTALDIYGGVARLLRDHMSKRGVTYDLVNVHEPGAVEAAIKPNTRLIWVDSISNPLLQVTDIARMADIARRHKLLLGVDNTLATPYYLNPMAQGADLVLHSCTKYLGGHTDLFAGVVVMREELHAPMHAARTMTGSILGPFDAWLVLRSLKTLAVRMDRISQNALAVARFLEAHPRVKHVLYPGLESHHHHVRARRQMQGFGGLITFGFEGVYADAVRVVDKFRVISSAVSFGSVESLSEIPPQPSPALCAMAEISDGLAWLRIAIGLEHHEDLTADLDQALSG